MMARTGITYDEVAQAAVSLLEEGKNPTIQRVREVLGTGSLNTIHRHLTAWKQQSPQQKRETPHLPADLQTALVQELERQASVARAEAEAAAIEARKTADELASIGEALEEENERLIAEIEERERERDQAQVLANERAKEISRLVEQVEREQKAAESIRLELATALIKGDAQDDLMAELKAELASLRL